MTVFALMVFMLVVSVLANQYQSALFYVCYTDANTAADLSVDAFLATYQKVLRDRYGILAVDAGYGQGTFKKRDIEEQLIVMFQNNMQSSLTCAQLKKVILESEPVYTWLIDGSWDFFIREITLSCQELLVDQGVSWIADQWKTKNNFAEKTFNEKKALAEESESLLDNDEKKDVNEYDVSISDPRDGLIKLINQGILKAACPSDYIVSDKEISMRDVSYPETGERLGAHVDFKNQESVFSLFSQWETILSPETIVKDAAESLAVQTYIRNHFRNAVVLQEGNKEQESVLDYEMEYLLGGQEKDSENLKIVLWKLMALRCVFNLSYLMSSTEKSQQVLAVASALAGVLVVPQFTEVTAFMLKMAWAFAESLADCRTLLRGGSIPLVKDKDSWYLTWEKMSTLQEGMLDGNSGQSGMDYHSYLQILMSFTETDIRNRRMTHLMEKNIRQISGYEKFWIKNCIYGIQVTYRCSFGKFGNYDIQTALSY